MTRFLSLILLSFVYFSGIGQNIQWASSLDFAYNLSDQNSYSANTVLGEPDAAPYGQLNEKAFRLNSEAGFGTVVVNFEQPLKVRNVVIIENNLPGRITSVLLYEENGTRLQVYSNGTMQVDADNRTLIINTPEIEYSISKVEVNIDTQTYQGWSQIDAIGITNEEDTDRLKLILANKGLGNFHEESSYGGYKLNMGPNINTEYNETKPVVSPDGKTLYFCRQNYPNNIRGIEDPQDIYFSKKIGNEWSKAENIGAPLNDIYANGVNSVSPDGNSLLLINQYSEFQPVQNGVSLSYKNKNGWQFPEKLNVVNYFNKSEYADFFLSSDGKALIMAIERDDSHGDQDLYVSLDQWGNNWSEPINLGNVLNTNKAEFAPFLAPDGKTLYFASTGHEGFGNSDIFYAKRLDDTWLNWSKPKNLGSMVNSADWDAYYSTTAKGDFAYFVSTKNGNTGSKDIFKIPLPKEIKPDPVLLVNGRLIDQITNKPINAKLEFRSSKSNEILGSAKTNPITGAYMVTIPTKNDYYITAQAKGYLTQSDTLLALDQKDYMEIRKNVRMESLEVGKKLIMHNINFEQSKAVLLDESYPELGRLTDFLSENPEIVVELGGHTDRTGSQKLNFDLSEERVKVVKAYLEKNGIDSKRMIIKAYGASQPVASNASEETRKLNRRVEVTILKINE